MDTQLIDRFTHFAEEAERKYGVVCQLADIRGARWSYVAGPRPARMPATEPMRITLGPDTGMVVYDMKGLSGEDLDKIKQEALSLWGRLWGRLPAL